MRLNVALLPAALLAFAIAACQQDDPNNIAIDDTNGAMDNAVANSVTAEPTATTIPAGFHGRWGLVAADCTSTRGDAKGLITVADKTIRFYESTATLKEQQPAIATSFAGLYGFTGEGQTWQKVVTLTRTGDTLKRADDEGSYTYKRCM